MPTPATIRSLRVQATQTVDLSFNMPGVIAQQNFDHSARTGPAFLGQRVAAFDIKAQIYDHLADVVNADTGRFTFDSNRIRTVLQTSASPPYLLALRNEALAAALDQAIARREAAWMNRFKHANAIALLMADNMPRIVSHLETLREKSTERFTEVDNAYDAADTPDEFKGGVLKSLKTKTEVPASHSRSTTTNHPVIMVSSPFITDRPEATELTTKVFKEETTDVVQTQKTTRTASTPMNYKADGTWGIPVSPFETQVVSTDAGGIEQVMTSTVQALSHPRLDNNIGYNQAMVALLQEVVRQKSILLSTPDVEAIMQRELAAADADIRILQLNFAHSFLLPPISGLVTGLFKDVGESVEPGEPVMRIENDAWVMLIGRLQCRAPLRPGRDVEVVVASVFEDGTSITLNGKIISIRGHEADNDEWEMIIAVENPNRLLPINYHFDPDTDAVRVL